MPERTKALEAFLQSCKWQGAGRSTLADDASFRRYDRLKEGARTAVLMDAPPPKEDVRPFIRIAEHLRSLGLSAPEIYAQDPDQGFLLLEDFGDETYTQVLKKSPERELALYELAVDALIYLHKKPAHDQSPAGVGAYDSDQLLAETNLLTDWYLPFVTSEALPKEALVSYQEQWRELFDFVQSGPKSLVLRDFHVDNLVWLEGRSGIEACGLLDFQDALIGSRAYDLMSLLEDARRDISDELIDHLKRRYLAAFDDLARPGPALDAFNGTYAILGAGRHAKVIGIFVRLSERDGKSDYLLHIPRVWRLLERSLRHPMLSSIRDWFDIYVPENLRKRSPESINEDK